MIPLLPHGYYGRKTYYLLIGQIVSPLYRPYEVGTLEVAKRALYCPYQEMLRVRNVEGFDLVPYFPTSPKYSLSYSRSDVLLVSC